MFSKLSKGYGSWNAGYVDPYFGEKRAREHTLPEIEGESHCHGITVGPGGQAGPQSGRSTAMSWATTNRHSSRELTSDSLPLPKTYTTRRGALQIYVAPEDEGSEEGGGAGEEEGLAALRPRYVKRPSGQELIDLSLKLGTMDRLVMSVLQFGDQEYDHEQSSVSDEKNKAFLKFLHSVDSASPATTKEPKLKEYDHEQSSVSDEKNKAFLKFLHSVDSAGPATTQAPQAAQSVDTSVQPGGDLNTYLRELRSSSSLRQHNDGSTYLPKSRESLELQAMLRGLDNNSSWPPTFSQDGHSERGTTPGMFTRPVSRVSSRGPSPGPPSTPRSSYQVLSSKKLAASLKSGSYLGRPASQFSVADEDSDSEAGIPAHVTSASVTRRQWSPTDAQDDTLLALRDELYRSGSAESEGDDSKKRRRFKERSFLTGTDLLSQGRNMYKVDGSHLTDVKVTGKGDGHSEGKGQGHSKLEIVEETGEGKISSGEATAREESEETESTAIWAENVAAVQRLNEVVEREGELPQAPIINIQEVGDERPQRVSSASSVRSRSRHGSNASSTSLASRSSKPAFSIISIQVPDPSKVPTKPPDKPFVGLKRRKSLPNSIYSPDKYVQQVYRQKSPKQRPVDHFSEAGDFESEAGESVYSRPPPRVYTFGPGMINWSAGDEQGIQTTMAPENTPDLSHEQAHFHTEGGVVTFAEDVTDEARRDSGHSDTHSLAESNKDAVDNVEPDEFITEEDLLDNIQECNKEVERIESKDEHADDSSDSGTYVDEEDMIKVIREMEKEQGIERTPTAEGGDKVVDTHEDVDVEGEVEAEIEVGVEEVEVEQQQQHQDLEEETVDEVYDENQSSVSRSRRSSRLSKSGRTLGEDSNEEDDSDESALAPLLSEQFAPKDEVPAVDEESSTQADINSDLPEPAPPETLDSGASNDEVNKSAKDSAPAETDIGDDTSDLGDVAKTEIKVVIETKSEDTVTQVIDKNQISEESQEVVIPETDDNELEGIKNIDTEDDKTLKTDIENVDDPAISAGETEDVTKSADDTVTVTKEEEDATAVRPGADKDSEKPAEKETTGLVAQASSVEQSGDGSGYLEEADIPLQISTPKDAHAIASELDALGLRQPAKTASKKKGKKEKAKGSRYVPPPPPSRRVEAPKEDAKIPDHLKDLLNRKPTTSAENLEKDLERRGFLKDGKVTDLVDESLSGPTLEAVGEGLTEEELELAKQILMQKIDDAKGKIDGREPRAPTGKKKAAAPAKGGKKSGKKKKGVDERTEEEIERDMIREKHALEKQHRDKEAKELQRKIAERKKLLQLQENMAGEKQKEIREKMEQLEREADDLQQAEDEARDILAEVRRKQREERDARRKADLERKKNEATSRRERERRELDEKRKKENDMLEKIADAEMRRRLREEEEVKAFEEERLAQEKYEEEMREALRHEEEEEERLKEMERQAEEEAMQRLIEERETAERMRRRLMEEEEVLRAEEMKKMEIMLEEERKLEEQRLKLEAEENAKKEAERDRLMELRRLEEEARMKLQEELERRRGDAMARRDYNLENRGNVDKLRHGQGITRAWTFSYFIQWPRETYERPMGGDDKKKPNFRRAAPKKPEAPPEGAPAAGQPPAPEAATS